VFLNVIMLSEMNVLIMRLNENVDLNA